jgi:hypothetical protein
MSANSGAISFANLAISTGSGSGAVNQAATRCDVPLDSHADSPGKRPMTTVRRDIRT